jgi:hypothetical protein
MKQYFLVCEAVKKLIEKFERYAAIGTPSRIAARHLA